MRPSKTASACEPGGSAATMIRGPVARSPFSHQPVPRIAPAAAQRGWQAAFRSISARVPRHHLTEADRKRGRRGALAAERRDADARPTGSANRRSASAGSAATRRGTTVDRTASAAPASVSGSTPRTDPAIRTKIGSAPRASVIRVDREGAVLAPDLAGAMARAGFGPTLEARELQHALISAIADRRGCCSDFRAPFPPRSWATTATRTASVRYMGARTPPPGVLPAQALRRGWNTGRYTRHRRRCARRPLACPYSNSSASAVGCHDHDVDRGNARLILATTGTRATDASANTTFDRRRCNLRSASIARGPAQPDVYWFAFHWRFGRRWRPRRGKSEPRSMRHAAEYRLFGSAGYRRSR